MSKPTIYSHYPYNFGFTDFVRGLMSLHELYGDTHNVCPIVERESSLRPYVNYANIVKWKPCVNLKRTKIAPYVYSSCKLHKKLLDTYINEKEDTHISYFAMCPTLKEDNQIGYPIFQYLYVPINEVQYKVDDIRKVLPKKYHCLHVRSYETVRNKTADKIRLNEAIDICIEQLDKIRHELKGTVVVIADHDDTKKAIKNTYPEFIISPACPFHIGRSSSFSFEDAVSFFLDIAIIKNSIATTTIHTMYYYSNGVKTLLGSGNFAKYNCAVHGIPFKHYKVLKEDNSVDKLV